MQETELIREITETKVRTTSYKILINRGKKNLPFLKTLKFNILLLLRYIQKYSEIRRGFYYITSRREYSMNF